MGYRIHVAEIYQVKRRLYDNFNGKSEAINRMLAEKIGRASCRERV